MYWQKLRTNGGEVVELWPLRPDFVKAVPDIKTMIGGYQYAPSGVDAFTFPPMDVIVHKNLDPLNLLKGLSPVQVAARIIDVDNDETDYIKLFWEKGGVPSGILKSRLQLDDQMVSDIARRWRERYSGFNNWTAPAILDNDAEYQKIALSFSEMGLETLDGRDETRICMVLGVPPIIIGTTYGLGRGTFSNYAEARKAWWEDFLMPQYKQLADDVNNQLVPDFGEDVYVAWDFSKVPALQEDQNARWQRATTAFTAGAITINEFCEQVGLEGKGKDGEVYVRSNQTGVVGVGNPADDTPIDQDDAKASVVKLDPKLVEEAKRYLSSAGVTFQ
jgi:HK97 family phage portal protein